MRKLLISTALAAVALSAAPASAQYRDYDRNREYGYNQGYGRGGNIDQRIDRLGERIERAYQRRAISGNEYRNLRNRLVQIDRRYDQYRYNGLSQREFADIQNRLQDLQQQIREDRQDGRRYDDRRYDERRYDRNWN